MVCLFIRILNKKVASIAGNPHIVYFLHSIEFYELCIIMDGVMLQEYQINIGNRYVSE